jgi:O-antigen biosynthesis protein
MVSNYDFPITEQTLRDNNTVAAQLAWLGTDKRVLELGCATGRVTEVLKQRGCHVVAVEYSAAAAALAARFADQIVVGSLEDPALLATLTGPYDVILAGDVLEHLRNPEDVLRTLKTTLAPGGCVIVSVPNIAHWSVRKELLRGRFNFTETGVMDRTHLRWFTQRTLRDMLERAGYQQTHTHAVATLPMQDALKLRPVSAFLARKHIAPGLLGIQILARATPV